MRPKNVSQSGGSPSNKLLNHSEEAPFANIYTKKESAIGITS